MYPTKKGLHTSFRLRMSVWDMGLPFYDWVVNIVALTIPPSLCYFRFPSQDIHPTNKFNITCPKPGILHFHFLLPDCFATPTDTKAWRNYPNPWTLPLVSLGKTLQ
jgi:hypothetical protein